MNPENLQIMQRQDSIVLRSAPLVRKPKAEILGVVVDSAPLTVYQVKTARGKPAYKFEARTKKYAGAHDMIKLAYKILSSAKPQYAELVRERQRRYYQRHREEILAKKKAQRKEKQA